jgi:hypothetical protein
MLGAPATPIPGALAHIMPENQGGLQVTHNAQCLLPLGCGPSPGLDLK